MLNRERVQGPGGEPSDSAWEALMWRSHAAVCSMAGVPEAEMPASWGLEPLADGDEGYIRDGIPIFDPGRAYDLAWAYLTKTATRTETTNLLHLALEQVAYRGNGAPGDPARPTPAMEAFTEGLIQLAIELHSDTYREALGLPPSPLIDERGIDGTDHAAHVETVRLLLACVAARAEALLADTVMRYIRLGTGSRGLAALTRDLIAATSGGIPVQPCGDEAALILDAFDRGLSDYQRMAFHIGSPLADPDFEKYMIRDLRDRGRRHADDVVHTLTERARLAAEASRPRLKRGDTIPR